MAAAAARCGFCSSLQRATSKLLARLNYSQIMMIEVGWASNKIPLLMHQNLAPARPASEMDDDDDEVEDTASAAPASSGAPKNMSGCHSWPRKSIARRLSASSGRESDFNCPSSSSLSLSWLRRPIMRLCLFVFLGPSWKIAQHND